MIAAVIRWSARNLMLVLIGDGASLSPPASMPCASCRSTPSPISPTRRSSSTPSTRAGAAGGRGPGHLSADHRDADRAARRKVVRGFSFFGVSFVYVIFEDGTDIYWARTRVLEYLNAARAAPCRPALTPTLGPDATGVGWVYQYAVIAARTHARRAALAAGLGHPLRARQGRGRRRGRQRRRLRQAIQRRRRSQPPARRSASRSQRSARSIRASNMDVGGRTIELAETRIHGARPRLPQGHRRPREDRRQSRTAARRCCCATSRASSSAPTSGAASPSSTAKARWRAASSLQRFGANALTVIDNVKAAPRRDRASAAEGVEIVPVYDRSELIHRAIDTLKRTLLEESVIVALVCIVFLLHVRSALVAILMLPVGILMAFIAMQRARASAPTS